MHQNEIKKFQIIEFFIRYLNYKRKLFRIELILKGVKFYDKLYIKLSCNLNINNFKFKIKVQ
jgi:hypothetical protein